jgi:DNA-binding NtrC family response regulator
MTPFISGATEHVAVEVAVGKFCAALFYRLNVLHLAMTASNPSMP